MKNILVPAAKSDSLIHQLEVFYKTFKNINPDTTVNFDLSKTNWIYPLTILPVSSHVYGTKSKYNAPSKLDTCQYLRTICFPDGVSNVFRLQDSKDYIPISLIQRKNDIAERERVLYCFLNLIYKTIGHITGTKDAIFYPILELVNNIFEHSKKDYGFIFGQIYHKKKYLDLCILDRGRGLVQSYEQEKGIKINNREAIAKAMSGDSTKGKERGYGIKTAKKTVCEGFKGEFLILSGDACLVSKGKEDQLFILPDFNWQGVILAYRIPFPKSAIDIYQYLE